jgi:hypothetical protein
LSYERFETIKQMVTTNSKEKDLYQVHDSLTWSDIDFNKAKPLYLHQSLDLDYVMRESAQFNYLYFQAWHALSVLKSDIEGLLTSLRQITDIA